MAASDDEEESAEVDSEEITIENSLPSIPGVYLSPASPGEEDDIECTYTTFEDADFDSDQSTFAWSINGSQVSTGTSLSSGFTDGDTVMCTVTPFDGLDEGTPVSASAVIWDSFDCNTTGDGYWPSAWAELECEVLQETNAYRALGYNCDTEGVFGPAEPLTMNTYLRKAARLHSEWMADTDTFSHGSPGGPNGDDLVERVENAGYTDWSLVGENIATGYTTPADVVLGWMESDGHCANIMAADFEEIGIGYHYNSSDAYKHWWTQDFGTPF